MAAPISELFDDKLPVRFWAKVDVRGPDECWLWTATKDRQGYGAIMMRDHKPRRAHHVALHLDGRPRPGDAHTLHACDNRACVNPRHLRWGTIAENARDKAAKGRCPDTSGENHAFHKLTVQDVIDIRGSDETHRALGKKFGVSHSTIGAAKRREKWKCVP